LRELIALTKTLPSQLIWIRTTPLDENKHNRLCKFFHRFSGDWEVYNATADRVMTEAAVPLADLCTFTRNLGPDLFCDHIHFHEHIRKQQGAFLAGWLDAWRQREKATSNGK
jgi:hypothetical protein